jgi:sensor histidine kinase YesM
MLDRIRDLVAEEYHIEIQLKHAEYKALQAQVNPHFLYNTLEAMAGIALTEKGSLVAELCRTMSRLFRYNLDMKNPLSTVREELDHLKNYLYIMNVRTRDSLHFELVVPEDLLEIRVPRLSLQPLVENSILHGLKNQRGPKSIRIGGHQAEGVVTIFVEDNGCGMDGELFNRQLRSTSLGVTGKNDSIGLGNIHARLLLLFGPDYGLRIVSEPGKGTRVDLAVPLQSEAAS